MQDRTNKPSVTPIQPVIPLYYFRVNFIPICRENMKPNKFKIKAHITQLVSAESSHLQNRDAVPDKLNEA